MVTLSADGARARMHHARWVAVAVMLCCAPACSGSTGLDGLDLTTHRAAWDAQHITSYEYDYLVTGYFIDYEGKPIRIVVRDGAVQSAVFIANGEPTLERPSYFPTIDQLFDRAAKERADGVLTAIRYDSRYDFPTQMDISGPPDASGSLFATNLEPVQ